MTAIFPVRPAALGGSMWKRCATAMALMAVALIAGIVFGPAQEATAAEARQPADVRTAEKIDAGGSHTCAILDEGAVRCWGSGGNGQLGYGNKRTIGDNEAPARAGFVELGRPAIAISTGALHTCAILDDNSVRCWGRASSGQLGYGGIQWIGDDETPASIGPVDLGTGRTAVAISAGGHHTCAILDNGAVRCWGDGEYGVLGYGNVNDIGNNETPGSVGTVDLGPGRTAVQIDAGVYHTCAVLDNGALRCWGSGAVGKLGYGNESDIGDDETPGSVPPVNLGAGRTARAVASGFSHTCAILDTKMVRCWGFGDLLGTGNTESIGDDEAPASGLLVDLGAGRIATAIAAGERHTCAVLDAGTVRCWGDPIRGLLGYGNGRYIGDNETPGSIAPVNLGAGRGAAAIGAGGGHNCVILRSGAVRCWGFGEEGALGYGNTRNIGDDETPASAGLVNLGSYLPNVFRFRRLGTRIPRTTLGLLRRGVTVRAFCNRRCLVRVRLKVSRRVAEAANVFSPVATFARTLGRGTHSFRVPLDRAVERELRRTLAPLPGLRAVVRARPAG